MSDLDKERVAHVVAETDIDIVEPADITFGEQGVPPAALTLQHLLEMIMEVIPVLDTG